MTVDADTCAAQKCIQQEATVHQRTLQKLLKQSEVAERMNIIIVKTTRCMLAKALLPKFWVDAVFTVVYLRDTAQQLQ